MLRSYSLPASGALRSLIRRNQPRERWCTRALPLTDWISALSGRTHQEEFSSEPRDNERLRFFQRGNGGLSSNCGKIVEEVAERLPALQIVQQRLKRHARAPENGNAAQNILVFDEDVARHCHALPLKLAPSLATNRNATKLFAASSPGFTLEKSNRFTPRTFAL